MKKLVLVLLAICFCSSSASAQALCDESEVDAVFTCLATNNLPACLALYPDCTQADLDNATATSVISNYFLSSCCDKGGKGKTLGCLQRRKAAFRSGRSVFPPEMRSSLLEDLATAISSVKSTGACPVAESE